jgi:Fe-S cluster biogenesis protein NfuA
VFLDRSTRVVDGYSIIYNGAEPLFDRRVETAVFDQPRWTHRGLSDCVWEMALRKAKSQSSRALHASVAAALALVRPAVRADGGDIELVDIGEDGVVRVRLLGGCVGCPSASVTLTHGIE